MNNCSRFPERSVDLPPVHVNTRTMVIFFVIVYTSISEVLLLDIFTIPSQCYKYPKTSQASTPKSCDSKTIAEMRPNFSKPRRS